MATGIGVFDANLMFFEDDTHTASVSSAALVIRGTPVRGLAARVIIPEAPDTTTTILPRLWTNHQAAGGVWHLTSVYAGGAFAGGTAYVPRELIVPLVDISAHRVILELQVSGLSGSWGAFTAGLVENPGGDWSRTVNWA